MHGTPRTPRLIHNYTGALIQSGAQMAMIIDQMSRQAQRNPESSETPVSVVLEELCDGILLERLDGFSDSHLKAAARVLVAATEAIGRDLFFVDIEGLEEDIQNGVFDDEESGEGSIDEAA